MLVCLGTRAAATADVAAADAAPDSTWRDHYRAARAARAAGDFGGFRAQMLRVGELIGEQPGVNYQLACAAARLGEPVEALRRLELFAASGLTREVAADSEFVTLWDDADFRRLAERIRANGDSIGIAREHHRFGDASLLTEDLAYDPGSRSYFATSIHRGRVIEVRKDGSEREWVDRKAEPGWGVLAACVDAPRRLLWTSVAATPTAEGFAPADSGRTGLVAWDLRSRRPVRRIEWLRDGRDHLLGDLTVGPDGTVYVTDSRSGALRRLRSGSDSLETLILDGMFESPQTPALAPDGVRLYLPDYSRGIAVVDLRTGNHEWLRFAPGIALQGIDGLYTHGGDLIAVQNGTRPARVMRFRLDSAGTKVESGVPIESGTRRLGEPTHGVVVGSEFCFLANTGWDRVGPDGILITSPIDAPPALLIASLEGAGDR